MLRQQLDQQQKQSEQQRQVGDTSSPAAAGSAAAATASGYGTTASGAAAANRDDDEGDGSTLSYTDGDEDDGEETDNDGSLETYETDEKSGLLSWSAGGGSWRSSGNKRPRAGSYVSYSARSILGERIKQSIRNVYELFFPPEEDPWESSPYINDGRERQNSHRNKVAVIFNFVLLALGYCAERSTFKVLVDKAGPFRLCSAEVITGFHALILGFGMLGSSFVQWFRDHTSHSRNTGDSGHKRGSNSGNVKGLGLPVADLGLMAVLDTAHLLLAVISGSIIPPVLTVILVQFTIPLTVFITEFLHPKGRCRQAGGVMCCIGDLEDDNQNGPNDGHSDSRRSPGTPNRSNVTTSVARPSDSTSRSTDAVDDDDDNASTSSFGRITGRHQCGALLIFLAITLVVSPAIMMILDPATSRFNFQEDEEEGVDPAIAAKRSAWNTLLFAFSCVPAAASQLYKEHTLAHFRQPVDPNRLNFLLSTFQFIFAMIVSPLLYPLQGLANGDNWTALYPSKQTSQNFWDGFECLVTGTIDEAKASSLYPEPAYCKYSWVVVLVHVFGIIVVGYAVERIAERGATRMVHRAISCGFVLAVVAMYIYEVVDPSVKYGPVAHTTNLFAASIILFGSEMYHSAATSEASYETTYEQIGDIYEDEEES